MKTCETGLQDPEIKNSCRASILALSSMIHSRMGKPLHADQAKEQSKKLIADSAGSDAVRGSTIPPYWFDWVVAELLVREAEQEIERNR